MDTAEFLRRCDLNTLISHRAALLTEATLVSDILKAKGIPEDASLTVTIPVEGMMHLPGQPAIGTLAFTVKNESGAKQGLEPPVPEPLPYTPPPTLPVQSKPLPREISLPHNLLLDPVPSSPQTEAALLLVKMLSSICYGGSLRSKVSDLKRRGSAYTLNVCNGRFNPFSVSPINASLVKPLTKLEVLDVANKFQSILTHLTTMQCMFRDGVLDETTRNKCVDQQFIEVAPSGGTQYYGKRYRWMGAAMQERIRIIVAELRQTYRLME